MQARINRVWEALMDLDALLAARESDGASGENLEYDPDFMELQRLAAPGEERQAGKEIVAGEEPDFKDVETRALAMLERSHDLRVAVTLCNARLNTKGLVGFADGVAYIRRCLEEHWDTCHPQLDAEDDNDPTFRISAIWGLNGLDTTQRYLRRTPLTQSRTFGRLTLLMIQQAYGEIPVPDGAQPEVDRAGVNAAFSDTKPEALTEYVTAARQILADVQAIDRRITGVIRDSGINSTFTYAEVTRILQQIVRHLSDHVAGEPEAEKVEEGDEDTGSDTGAAPSDAAPRRSMGGAMANSVESAGDARAAIDRVIGYFKRYEPSSPVPIILERAKRLVGADFLTIMKDMAPDGLDSVHNIGGIKPKDDDDDD
jgi:type VI secretion system protein ImpA